MVRGAGSLTDIDGMIRSFWIIGAAASGFFVFNGRYWVVLMNYPNRDDKDSLFVRASVQICTANKEKP